MGSFGIGRHRALTSVTISPVTIAMSEVIPSVIAHKLFCGGRKAVKNLAHSAGEHSPHF